MLSPKTSAKYCRISVTIVAKTQDLVILASSNAQTGTSGFGDREEDDNVKDLRIDGLSTKAVPP